MRQYINKKNNMKYNKCYKLIIIVLILLLIEKKKELYNVNNIERKVIQYIKQNLNYNLSKYEFKKEIPQIIEYVKQLKNNSFNNNTFYFEISKPRISFIASVFNKEKYLIPFILSIQNQNLKEFEIIFVDDCSIDKSLEIIINFKNKDKRIKLIKNKKNKGSLYARCSGALYAKGDYIIFVDSDDIILKDGILKSYNHLKTNNLEMVQFLSLFEGKNSTFINKRNYIYSSIIYQPILSYIFYYDKKEGIELNTALWDKLIKKNVVLKSINYIGPNYINKRIIIENDVIILFSLFRYCDSFQYIYELGYYYFIKNNDSITNTRFDPKKANQIIYSIFCNIKFLYEKTGNSYFDKYFCVYKLEQGYNRYQYCLKYLNQNLGIIKHILNEMLKSNYISLKKKLKIKNIKNKIFLNRNLNKSILL